MQIPATQDGKLHADAFKERTGMELNDEKFEKDWCETNAARIPIMSKLDIDDDEIEMGYGANIWLDEGDEKVLPSLKVLAVGEAEHPSIEVNVDELLVESGKKLEGFKNFKKDEVQKQKA